MIKFLLFIISCTILLTVVVGIDAFFKWLEHMDEVEEMERYVESLVKLLNS